MIYESGPWRDELLKVADRLERRVTQKRWFEQTSYLVERDVMVGAYTIRKLHEARKVSDKLVARRLRAYRHKLIGRVPDHYFQEWWESFDVEHPTSDELKLLFFCNQIIHSFIFALSFREDTGAFDGVFVASDYERKKALYLVPIEVIVELFRAVGNENIVSMKMVSHPVTGERYWTEIIAEDDS